MFSLSLAGAVYLFLAEVRSGMRSRCCLDTTMLSLLATISLCLYYWSDGGGPAIAAE